MEKAKITDEELLSTFESRYHLINLAAKRARSLVETGDNVQSKEAIRRSLEEISEGKVRIKDLQEGGKK